MATLEKKKSPQPSSGKIKLKLAGSNAAVASDSDASGDTNSLSADSAAEQSQQQQQQQQTQQASRKKQRRRSSEWEIMEGLKNGQRFESKPDAFSGFLHKKRKWPLKGWHKRYFVLDKGILIYGKGPSDINKGKVHGSVDIGLSVISSKVKRRRIDIDAEEFIYHLKAKTEDTFSNWVKQLTVHRLYRQHILTYGAKVGLISHAVNECDNTPEILSRDGSLTRGLKPIGVSGGRLSNWLLDSGPPLDKAQHDSAVIEKNINKLNQLLQQIEIFHITSAGAGGDSESLGDGLSPSIKKDRRKFGLKKKKSSKGGSVDLTMTFNKTAANEADNTSPLSNNSSTGVSSSPQCVANSNSFGSSGNTTLPVPCISQSLPASDNISCNLDMQIGTAEYQLKEEFITNAKSVLNDLKSLLHSVKIERDRLKAALDAEMKAKSGTNQNHAYALECSLNQALQQNIELRKRLTRIYEVSDISDLSVIEPNSETQRHFNVSLSYSSSCASEFFDAEDLPVDKHNQNEITEDDNTQIEDIDPDIRTHGSDSSSEAGSLSSGEGSLSSESELGAEFTVVNNFSTAEGGGPTQGLTGHRTTLPAPRPDTEGLSLWNLLCKNIGKDLSQISMPVALNEPLNMLQRLCEELEYSELLDKASELDDPYERMVHVAAFAVSSYASSYSRAGNKPFNPLLGETYECIREDRGFKFIAEQVSHHPPISACHAESKNYTFWQEARIKTKFWGKSMEFQPMGRVYVLLAKTGDLYSWNKVTTCVHNLFSGQRWVDQYGELRITNGRISCKLTFAKASYWSAKRHEVVGAVYDESGKTVKQLFGKWSEALYCGIPPAARCIWRAGTMPPDHQRYYGFTRFAMELNELGPDSYLLPPTDTRLRPDQRALERGDLEEAERLKAQLENAQRDRRKQREEKGEKHEPKWFTYRKEFEEELWQYNGRYWEMRRSPGFTSMQFEALW